MNENCYKQKIERLKDWEWTYIVPGFMSSSDSIKVVDTILVFQLINKKPFLSNCSLLEKQRSKVTQVRGLFGALQIWNYAILYFMVKPQLLKSARTRLVHSCLRRLSRFQNEMRGLKNSESLIMSFSHVIKIVEVEVKLKLKWSWSVGRSSVRPRPVVPFTSCKLKPQL